MVFQFRSASEPIFPQKEVFLLCLTITISDVLAFVVFRYYIVEHTTYLACPDWEQVAVRKFCITRPVQHRPTERFLKFLMTLILGGGNFNQFC